MRHSCMSVDHNTCAWEKQEWNKTEKMRMMASREKCTWKDREWAENKEVTKA